MLHWQYFCGALGYSDDITLLAPTLSSLKYMLNICYQFSKAYDVIFNSTKCKLLCFGRSDFRSCVHVPHVEFNGSVIELIKHNKHLDNVIGTKLFYISDIKDCLSAFNGKVNMVKSHFDHIDYIIYLKHIACYCVTPSFRIMKS